MTLGTIAVWLFFAPSGFLIYKSFERQSLPAFVEARVLRIYPALVVVGLVTVFLLGQLFTTLPLGDYFRSAQTVQWIPRLLSLKFVSFALPGVFGGEGVNGPVWTLWYEVVCYAGLVIGLSLTRGFRLFPAAYVALFAFLLHGTTYAELSLVFVTGMAIYRYRSLMPAQWWIAGLLSWHYVERPALDLKGRSVLARLRPRKRAVSPG